MLGWCTLRNIRLSEWGIMEWTFTYQRVYRTGCVHSSVQPMHNESTERMGTQTRRLGVLHNWVDKVLQD